MNFYQNLINQGYEQYLKIGEKTSPNNLSQACFDARVLPSAMNKITIKENLIEDIAFIKETIDAQRERGTLIETPFVLFGYEDELGNVIIDKVEIDYDQLEKDISTKKEQVAVFKGYLEDKINEYAKTSTHKKPVIIHGHTHPCAQKVGIADEFTNAFSFADLQAYKDLSENIEKFNNATGKNIQVAGLLINSQGDFNGVFCDVKHGGNFYKLNDIQIEGVGKLPSFQGKSIFQIRERLF